MIGKILRGSPGTIDIFFDMGYTLRRFRISSSKGKLAFIECNFNFDNNFAFALARPPKDKGPKAT